MNIIELGKGAFKIQPCFVSENDNRQAILFEPQDIQHQIGIFSDVIDPPYIPREDSTLLILGSVESAKVVFEQLRLCIQDMENEK